ncbi:MAG: PRC-barrel domain-containing protein [Acidobacteriia bacterium]|nr:PRC-barrel domain-containing protein [Terriglobia bacterium]
MARDYEGGTTMATSPVDLPPGDTSSGRERYRRVLSAGTLTGDAVKNTAGEDLGKIEDIMIDVPTGRVAYAVLSFGGFLGMGNKLFAVPWQALTVNERDHEFVLNVDKTTLENAPGFDKDNWPDMADPTWSTQVYGHYGYKTDWREAGSTRPPFDEGRNPNL